MSKIAATLRIQEPVIPGEVAEAMLVLVAETPVTIDWVSWKLHGHAHADQNTPYFAEASQRLAEATRLHGTLTLPIRFVLPRDAPPTFNHPWAAIRYELRVDVSIPWAWDPHWSWQVRVGVPPFEGTIPHDPVVVRSVDGVELSLDRQCFVPGDLITGRIAWPGNDAPNEIHIGVRERAVGQPGRQFGVVLILDRDESGMPFRFQLPFDLTPSFQSEWTSLRWEVYVAHKAPTTFRDFVQLTAPITIVSAAREDDASPKVAPVVGRARLRDAAARVGHALGWRTDEDSIDRTVQFGLSTLEASVHWDQRDRPYLVAEITMPSVMLGLETRARSFLDHLDATNRLLDHALAFTGREAEQAKAFLALLLRFTKEHALSLVHASDARLVIECVDAGGDDSALRAFLMAIDAVLALLPQAMLAIPVMRGVSVDVEAMRLFAQELRGTFTPGDCSVRGRLASGHDLHAHVLVPVAGELPSHLEVRLEGLLGSFAIARDCMFMRGNAGIRVFAETLDPNVAIEAENGEGSAILSMPEQHLVVTAEVIMELAESLLRASHLASGNGIFR